MFPPLILNEEASISKLIDVQNQCWKTNLLQQVFSSIEVITVIPIISVARLDKQVWSPTKNGLFLVHNAYHLQHSMSLSSRGDASTIELLVLCGNQSRTWKYLTDQRCLSRE